jgi:hypothetical protein
VASGCTAIDGRVTRWPISFRQTANAYSPTVVRLGSLLNGSNSSH